jgi:hypothetical protein
VRGGVCLQPVQGVLRPPQCQQCVGDVLHPRVAGGPSQRV